MTNVVSVNVGMPREVPWRGKSVGTAIWKRPVEGRVFAGRLNLAGDGQADLVGYGGGLALICCSVPRTGVDLDL